MFAQVLFAVNKVMLNSDLGREFEGRFPEVMAMIKKIKSRGFAQLAKVMQRYEAAFMYDRVVRRLMLEHPEVYVLTIHDSIMTLPEHAETIRSIMLEEFARLGLHPRASAYQCC